LISVSSEGISDFASFGSGSGASNKLVVNLLVYEDSAASDAALALVQEETNVGLLNG